MNRLQRFQIKYRVDSTGCWLWTAAKYYNGYGVFHMENGNHTAHRAGWLLMRGPVPEGMDVCHHCDVPECVNPDHLFIGTRQDNMMDRVRKGRHPRKGNKGSKNGRAKLTEADIPVIRSSAKRQIDLAAEYGVSQEQISAVKIRKTWNHVP